MSANPEEVPCDRLLKVEEAADMLGLPQSSFWALLAQGAVPRQIKIGRRSRWSSRELQAWIAEQSAAAQREGAAGGSVCGADSRLARSSAGEARSPRARARQRGVSV